MQKHWLLTAEEANKAMGGLSHSVSLEELLRRQVEGEPVKLNLIIKSDVGGTLEAMKTLSHRLRFRYRSQHFACSDWGITEMMYPWRIHMMVSSLDLTYAQMPRLVKLLTKPMSSENIQHYL